MAIRRAPIERIDISSAHARALLDRVRLKLADEEFRELKALVETLVYLARHAYGRLDRARARAALWHRHDRQDAVRAGARRGLRDVAGGPRARGRFADR